MKIMLHICCAPCSVAILQKLRQDTGLDVEGFFYNPNIHPEEEQLKRKEAVEAMSRDFEVQVSYEDAMLLNYWKDKLDGDKDQRCATCYAIRLDKAALFAKEKGCDAFTTSLLISPWQNHELIRELGSKASQKYGIPFHYEDFRTLYRPGRDIARGKNWYMQKFCGCFYSYGESTHPKKPIYNM